MATNSSSTASANATSVGAAGATKKGKVKGKTMDISEFLNKPINWAEEMEAATPADPDHGGGYGGDYTTAFEVRTEIIQKRSQLPTAPKAALSTTVDPNRVPTSPPYSAYVGNVSYNASDEDIVNFFAGLKVIKIRLAREGERLKGFGYVEFATRDELLIALSMDKQPFMRREIKIDLATRPEDRPQPEKPGYGSSRGGRQQRGGGAYDADKGRDREDSSGDWRNAYSGVSPPSQYEDDRRPHQRPGGPQRPLPPHSQMGYPYQQQQGYGPPAYGPPPQGYGRRPVEDYPPQQQYQRSPSGYDSDYAGGRYGGTGYENYPVMRQGSYSSNYSGYASDREGSAVGNAGQYRRGGQQGAGFYNSMRREYRGNDRRPPGPPAGNDHRYHGDEAYGAPRYPTNYGQQYYQEGYGTGRDGYGYQQRSRGGFDGRRAPPPNRESHGYDQQGGAYGGHPRTDERLSSANTEGSEAGENQPKDKERPRLALKPRTLPLPNQATGPTSVDGENSADDGQPQQTEQFTTTNRPRAVASTAEVFGGAKPVDTSAREREVEEKLKREQEEFRRHDEERKLQREHVRKTSSSNAPPERASHSGRRRTSDSQSSTGGHAGGPIHLRGSVDAPPRHDEDENGHQQVKILQRSRTAPSDITQDGDLEQADGATRQHDNHRRPQHSSPRPAPPPSQNAWSSQNRRRGGPGNEQHGDDETQETLVEQPSSKSTESQLEEFESEKGVENQVPSTLAEGLRSSVDDKPTETDFVQQRRESQDAQESDGVFKGHQRNTYQPGGHRGRGRGGRGRGGGFYHQQQQHDPASLPPRFSRDQQHFQRRGSNHTDDGQEQYGERRRPSKGELVIRRGGQGTLSPQTGTARRGGGVGSGKPPQPRAGSRERDYQQKGSDRRTHQQQASYRRGSADSGLPAPSQPQEDLSSQKNPNPRRQQQVNAAAPRKTSGAAAVVADPPPVSFESRNKFEMLDMEDD